MYMPVWAVALAVIATSVTADPCASDAQCPFDGAWRCCGATKQAENCPKPTSAKGGSGACVLPGAAGATECTCIAGVCQTLPESRDYAPKQAGKKQWLMIGDSIHGGCAPPSPHPPAVPSRLPAACPRASSYPQHCLIPPVFFGEGA